MTRSKSGVDIDIDVFHGCAMTHSTSCVDVDIEFFHGCARFLSNQMASDLCHGCGMSQCTSCVLPCVAVCCSVLQCGMFPDLSS